MGADLVRVALVDDHTLLRVGLKGLLEMAGTIRVVVDAGDCAEAIAAIAQTPCDVVLLDISLPGQDGLCGLRILKERWPELPVLMLSMHVEDEIVVAAINAGADGYIVKSASHAELLAAVTEVCSGSFYLHPRVSRIMKELRRPRGPAGQGGGSHLSPRESEMLTFLAQGMSNRDIADRLVLSEVTIKSHLRSLYRKLNVADRTQAAIWALRHGQTFDAGVGSLASSS
jgi:DNA-binding NarL/FixJ family response regulator